MLHSQVSVYSFELSTAGFTAQLKGILTIKRYRIATVFIDHYSNLSYVYMQHFMQLDNTSAEFLKVQK